jgi:hypothetical protein
MCRRLYLDFTITDGLLLSTNIPRLDQRVGGTAGGPDTPQKTRACLLGDFTASSP